MKNDKRKSQQRESKKKHAVKMEESLREKLFELIKSLGHDVVGVSEELVKMSRRLSKKLSKKMKNVIGSTDASSTEQKAKEAKANYTLPKDKVSKGKKLNNKKKSAKLKNVDLPTSFPPSKNVVKPKENASPKTKSPNAKISLGKTADIAKPGQGKVVVAKTSPNKAESKTPAKRGRPAKLTNVKKENPLPPLAEKKENVHANAKKIIVPKSVKSAKQVSNTEEGPAPTARGRKKVNAVNKNTIANSDNPVNKPVKTIRQTKKSISKL